MRRIFSPGCACFCWFEAPCWPSAASGAESVAGLLSDIGMLCSYINVVKRFRPAEAGRFIVLPKGVSGSAIRQRPRTGGALQTVLAQNPADAARVLANLVCHDDGFIPVWLQLPQFRGDFSVQYVNRASNMACVEIRFITHIQQYARPIIEHSCDLMGGNGPAIFYPLAPGIDKNQCRQNRDQQPLLGQKYDEVHWLAFCLGPVDRLSRPVTPRARAAVYTKVPVLLSLRP